MAASDPTPNKKAEAKEAAKKIREDLQRAYNEANSAQERWIRFGTQTSLHLMLRPNGMAILKESI